MASASRPTLIGSAACAALALGLLGGAGVANAAPAPDTAAPTASGILRHVVAPADVAAAAAGWTPARMRAAVSNAFVDADPAEGDPLTVAQLSASVVEVPTSTPTSDESTPVPGFSADDHLGVVFFRSGGQDQRCTGNVVVADGGGIVATAGRCVSALAGAFVTDLAFVPQYDGTAPKGVWAATAITARSEWVVDRQVDFDSGFFRVQAPGGVQAGATLSSTVGASGVRFAGQDDDDDYSSTGYALDGGHDGTEPVRVEGSVEPNPWMNEDHAIEGIETDLRQGISGSPWRNADDDSGDVQRGMTTFAYQRFTHAVFGPQWRSALHATYRAAAAS